jgi:hypothetical protein
MRTARLLMAGSIALAAVTLGAARDASAQGAATTEWRKGTALAVFGGAASGSGTRATTGASIGWELLPHLTIDGSGVWEAPRNGASAFAALIGVRVNLTPPAGLVPFASAGVGVYRASFDANSAGAPAFYQRRMTSTGLGIGREQTFDDAAFSVGGGVDVFLHQHLALRPDVRVMLVRGDSQTRAVAVYGVHLAYHFEEHPVTPRRGFGTRPGRVR